MSIHFPETLAQRKGNMILKLPAGATNKPADTGFVFGVWVEIMPQGLENNADNRPPVILGRDDASGGRSDDAIVRLTYDKASCIFYDGSGNLQVLVDTPTTLDFTRGGIYCFLVVQTATSLHLAVTEVGQTPVVGTTADPLLYTNALIAPGNATGGVFDVLGAGFVPYAEPLSYDNAFFVTGEFPEASGTLDQTLLENIANGVTEISDIPAQLSAGSVLQCHFPMSTKDDFADATGNFGTIFKLGTEALEEGKVWRSRGPLRPGRLMPDRAGHYISPARFTSFYDTATATADVHTEAGTFHEIAPAEIEARLLKEDNTEHVGWTVVDPAPSGGTWAESVLPDVPLAEGFLYLQFRAVDGSGVQIGDIVASSGYRGVGFSMSVSWAQSQMERLWVTPVGANFPTGIRLVGQKIGFEGFEATLSSGDIDGRLIDRGAVYMAVEIHNQFPRVPILISTVSQAGDTPESFAQGGHNFPRFAAMGARYGVKHPGNIMVHMGFSSYNGSPEAYKFLTYESLAEAEAQIGTLGKLVLCETPRIFDDAIDIRQGVFNARAAIDNMFRDNPKTIFGGSWGPIVNNNEADGSATADPHAEASLRGEGRSGGFIGYALMTAHGAIPGPAQITSATRSGTTVNLHLTPVNQGRWT